MAAERSFIETMARALWLHDMRVELAHKRAMGQIENDDGRDVDPSLYDLAASYPLTGPGFRWTWEGRVRALLQALLDAGPTKAMRAAFHEHEDPTDTGFANAFRAMLRAELEAKNG